jgi:hypothetical protein
MARPEAGCALIQTNGHRARLLDHDIMLLSQGIVQTSLDNAVTSTQSPLQDFATIARYRVARAQKPVAGCRMRNGYRLGK